jgi:histidinol-phosphate phosphatase family protein
MAQDAGNLGLFCDLAGTLVRMDAARRLPADADGKIKIELMPGVRERLGPIRDHLIFVVTNQSDISRGRFTLEQCETALAELDHQLGGILAAWQICPHAEQDACRCRKPSGAMIAELAQIYGVDLKASTMVGDQEVDELAGKAAGVGKFVHAGDFFGWK